VATFVVDPSAVLRLAAESVDVSAEVELEAPTLLRSHVLSILHEAVHRGELAATVAHERRARIRRLPIRLLGDAVLQRRAWEVADQLGWAETYTAEYVALAQLHRATLVTLDGQLAEAVKGIVPTISIDALR
jgi:predicted nucleic acid-binding protein